MSEVPDNSAKIERLYDAFENGGVRTAAEVVGEVFDPDVEFNTLQTGRAGGTYRGIEGVGAFFGELHSELEEVRYDPPQFHQIGEDVVAFTRMVGIDRRRSLPVRQDLALVYRFSNERVVLLESYDSPAEALEAAQRGHVDA